MTNGPMEFQIYLLEEDQAGDEHRGRRIVEREPLKDGRVTSVGGSEKPCRGSHVWLLEPSGDPRVFRREVQPIFRSSRPALPEHLQ
jgi:hypothetical protein